MRNMTKKQAVFSIVAVCVAVMLCVSLLPAQAQATAGTDYTLRLTDDSGNSVVNARPGDTVTLALRLENNPGMISVGVELSYPQQLSVADHEINADDLAVMLEQYDFVPNVITSQTMAVKPFLVWMNQATGTRQQKLVTYNGSFYEVSFKVAETAAAGDYTITLAAPSDKNTTAGVDGSGVILPNTNQAITNIALVSCTIHVGGCANNDHTWGAWTEVDENEHKRVCTVSGCDAEEQEGHAFGDWEPKDEASQKRTCADCGREETKPQQYTVTFRYDDGTVISETTYHYGETVIVPEDPEVPASLAGEYGFLGWNKTVSATCTGDAVYTATFARYGSVGDVDGDGMISRNDVVRLLLHVTLPNRFPIDAPADFTGDGVVDRNDVVRLLLHVTMPNRFPLETA